MNLSIPEVPVLFLKPSTSLADPWPSPTILPKITQNDDTGDYEAELVIVIGQDAKDVSEKDAMNYVLGYTAANDVSSRASQTNQTQWCFSKGIDTSCPIVNITLSKYYIICTDHFSSRPDFGLTQLFHGCHPIPHPWHQEWESNARLPIDVGLPLRNLKIVN